MVITRIQKEKRVIELHEQEKNMVPIKQLVKNVKTSNLWFVHF